MVASMPMTALAEGDASGNTDINIETKAATISLTVPSAITFTFLADGTNTLPTNYTIKNESAVDMTLNTITVSSDNGWELVASGDAKLSTTNAKAIHMTLDTKEAVDGVYTLNQNIAKTTGEHTIAFAVDRPAYSKAQSVNSAYKAVLAFSYTD